MTTTALSPAIERPERASRPVLGVLIITLVVAGLVAGGVGFALLAVGHTSWAQSLFVADLVAMLGSVSLGAFAPRSTPRSR